jgi:hypothetical protein
MRCYATIRIEIKGTNACRGWFFRFPRAALVGVNRCKMTRSDVLTRLDLPQRKASVEQTGLCTGFAESELLQIGRDPFLIAYAMVSPQECCVVSNEVPAPSKTKRKIPDVCHKPISHSYPDLVWCDRPPTKAFL